MFHTIILAGNLGRDPEMRYTQSGQAVTNFSVAVNDSYTNNSGERIERTLWFRVTTWGKLAETCNNYLKKGRKVLVEGRIVGDPATGGPKVWEGESGPRASFEINASTVRFLSSRAEDDAGYQAGEPSQVSDEDIPF
jgi:single-strand DNA-binding protein